MKREEVLGYIVGVMITGVILLAVFLPRGGGDPTDTTAPRDPGAKVASAAFRPGPEVVPQAVDSNELRFKISGLRVAGQRATPPHRQLPVEVSTNQ